MSRNHARPGRVARRWLPRTLLVGLAAASTAAPPGAQEPALVDHAAIGRALSDARRLSHGSAAELTAWLAASGPSALPALFDTLCAGSFDAPGAQGGEVTHALTQFEERVLTAAVGHCGDAALRTFLDQRIEEVQSEGQRLTALRLLGAHGSGADLRRLSEWSTPVDEESRVPRAWRGAFGAALDQLLDRHPEAVLDTTVLYRRAHISLLPAILRALGERPSEASMSALSQVLGTVPEVDAFVLVELGQVAQRGRRPADDATRRAVRGYLLSSAGPLLVQAISTVGRLEDHEAVGPLADLLAHPEPNVREQTRKALEAITGERLGDDRQDWVDWHQEIGLWWRRNGERLQRAVTAGEPQASSRALLELSQKRFFRHRLAGPVARGLGRSEEELVVLTCATLGHLGSRIAVPELLSRLEDDRLAVRRAVYLALRRITAEDHGEGRADWIAAGW